LDASFCARAAKLMRRSLSPKLASNESLLIEGELAHGYALLKVIIENAEHSHRAQLEVCVQSDVNNIDNPLDARDLALDFAHLVAKQYMAEDRFMVLPGTWEEHVLKDKTVLFRGERCNPTLEREAELLLAEHGFAPDGAPLHPSDDDDPTTPS
jgi:hypothetical protein